MRRIPRLLSINSKQHWGTIYSILLINYFCIYCIGLYSQVYMYSESFLGTCISDKRTPVYILIETDSFHNKVDNILSVN